MALNKPSRKIALAVTGGIAAYKSAELARNLTKAGYTVFPMMTEWAAKFVGPLTFEALTGQAVRIETAHHQDASQIDHIALIREVDLLVLAPLTANTMAKMVHGLADNFISTSYLAHTGPTLACPAMNTAMLQHPATVRNLETLKADGVHICMGEAGELACGETGAGRMAEPAVIMTTIEAILTPVHPGLQGKRVLVSAGPTCEDVDPVRFLSNRSSGKMGYALARALSHAGARVTLVHGPTALPAPLFVETRAVRSAAQMAQVILEQAPNQDMVVMNAAVADFRPRLSAHKLKKGQFNGVIELEPTTDILATLGQTKKPGQLLVGFAAETNDIEHYARAKLERKNLDVICANDVSSTEIGFAADQNRLLILNRHTADNLVMGPAPKQELATRLSAYLGDLAQQVRA